MTGINNVPFHINYTHRKHSNFAQIKPFNTFMVYNKKVLLHSRCTTVNITLKNYVNIETPNFANVDRATNYIPHLLHYPNSLVKPFLSTTYGRELKRKYDYDKPMNLHEWR